MTKREEISFCRTCTAHCGVRLTIDDDKIVKMSGDKDHPLSHGYACFKGLHQGEAHHGSDRLLKPLKRQDDGTYRYIPVEDALDEIADAMRELLDRYGPDSLAVYSGNGAVMNSAVTGYLEPFFLTALGTPHFYTQMTIDQPAKGISFERMGGWEAGGHRVDTADVMMAFGTNPVVSHAVLNFVITDPGGHIREAKRRGMKLIVIDPRKTETAKFADLFLQPVPGQDWAILAAMIRIILAEEWEDREFCERWVGYDRIGALRAAVEPFTEELACRRAGLQVGEIRKAVEMFINNGPRGSVTSGNGNNMAVFSNLTQHLSDCMNVICGRMNREGDHVLLDMFVKDAPVHAEVIPPPRSWEQFPPARVRGASKLLWKQEYTAVLPDEILKPGKGQVRGLFVIGGNPAVSIPDERRTVEALRKLELSVAVDPFMTKTASSVQYVLPPLMPYERADLSLYIQGAHLLTDNWMAYTPAIIAPPAESELVEDWYVFWSLEKRLGLDVMYNGSTRLEMDNPPVTEDLLAIRANDGRVPFEELKKYPSGKVWKFSTDRAAPARPGASGKFDVMPGDVAEELRKALGHPSDAANIVSHGRRFTHLLTSRRMRHMMNSVGTHIGPMRERVPYNPLHVNPNDMQSLQVVEGEQVEVESDCGRITAIIQADDSMRPGVVSMSHGWGTDELGAASVNSLVDSRRDIEEISSMPRMSGIPVNIRPAAR